MSDQNHTIGDDDLHAYVDGTLTGDRRRAVEDALERDPSLATRVSDYFSLNDMFHQRYDRILREPVPPRLQPPAPKRRWLSAANASRYAGLAAALVVGIGIGTFTQMGRAPALPGTDGRFAQTASADGGDAGFAREAAIAHVVYMPTVQRPASMDVDREEDLTRWMANQLGTGTHAPMLTASGFQLTGGRMLPGADGSVVEYMYRNAAGERVTICITPRKTDASTAAFQFYEDGPVKVYYWADGKFGYAVSGGIARDALLHVSHDVYAQLTGRT